MRPISCLKSMATVLVVILAGCATLQESMPVKPEASIQGVQVAGLTTQSVDLLVNLAVNNPNAFSLNASGFDMDLKVEGNSLAKVSQLEQGISLPAKGVANTQVPLTLNFNDLYQAVSAVKGKDEFAYAVDAGISFNLPVIGNVRLPAAFEGSLPIPKMPKVSIKSADFSKVGWTSASMLLSVEVENPNAFGLDLNNFNYNLTASGQSLGGGQVKSVSLGEKGSQILEIPLSLEFAKLGASLIKMIASGDTMDLNLTGKLDVAPALDIWQPQSMNVDLKTLLNQ